MKVLRVFADENGWYGNPVGVVVDVKQAISKDERQKMASESGFSEVVFVNDLVERNISIYTPKREIPFAGHAIVGIAFFLNQELKHPVTEIFGIGGKIDTWQENNLTWVKCDVSILPKWKYEQLHDSTQVEALTSSSMSDKDHTVVWAWISEAKGLVRARTFAQDWGIPEDEANGSGSMQLAVNLRRELTLRHGKGSIIHARPSHEDGMAEVGGRVIISD